MWLVARRILDAVDDHPVRTVFFVAFVSRIIFAMGSAILIEGPLIPDEGQYIELASYVADGRTPEEWFPGYGQSLYDSVRTFIVPLVGLFEVFGTHRIVGQLFSAVAGAGAATATAALARQFLTPRFAAGAGLVVALLPSQLLFSAVVLREAHVWLALTLVALGSAYIVSEDRRRTAAGLVASAAGLLALAYLREQTLLLAAWAFGLAMLLAGGPTRSWVARGALGVFVALFAPLLTGSGVAGRDLVTHALPNASNTRTVLSQGAESAFDPVERNEPYSVNSQSRRDEPSAGKEPVGPPCPGCDVDADKDGADENGAGADAIARRSETINEEANVTKSLGHVPRGLIDVGFRPLPWNATDGTTLLFARVENLAWYTLYLLALLGCVVSLRRRAARNALLFTILVVGMLLAASAMTQGNLGTAFRHRGQILWGTAVLAALGAHWLLTRYQERRAGKHGPSPSPLLGEREQQLR